LENKNISEFKVSDELVKQINQIKNEDWKNLILGFQEKLNIKQLDLLDMAGLNKDFHVSEWISGKRIPVFYKKFKLLEIVGKSNFNINELISFGQFVRQGIKLNDKWISTARSMLSKDNLEDLLIYKNNKIYLNSFRLFPEYKGRHPIRFVGFGDELIVFYDQKRSTRPTPLFLPKLIALDEIFLVGLGIYIGEGSRNRKPKVTNSEPIIISRAIKFFKLFGVKESDIKAWIQLHERSTSTIEESKKYWLENTSIKPENLLSVRIKKSTGNAKVKQFGTLHIEVYSIMFQLLISRLIEITPFLCGKLSNKEIIYFIQGLLAGEGSVGLAKSGSVNEVSYTSTRPEERVLVKNLLEKLNLKVKDYSYQFQLRMFGFDNLKSIFNMNLFKYHPLRRDKLNKGFYSLKSSLNLSNVGCL